MTEALFAIGGYLIYGSVWAAAIGVMLCALALLAETASRFL